MSRSIAMCLAVLVGCASDSLPESSFDVGVVEQEAGCNDWMCGTNAPHLLFRRFWDLNLAGQTNSRGVGFAGFEDRHGNQLSLGVHGGKLVGESEWRVVRGQGLVGSRIHLVEDGKPVVLRITQVLTGLAFWARNGGNPVSGVEAYLIEMAEDVAADRWRNLCSRPFDKEDLGLNGHFTVIFEGDRIDADKKIFPTKTIDPNWINFGCAGSALAKLHLLGYTHAASQYGLPSSISERQTMLKSITADYCGDGVTFTVAGTPLDWADRRQSLTFDTTTELEARWNAQGATCLNVPRLVEQPSELAVQWFPELTTNRFEELIASECTRVGRKPPPRCAPSENEPLDTRAIATGNPPWQPNPSL